MRIGKELPGEVLVVAYGGPLNRAVAGPVQPHDGPDGEEGKVRPGPRQDFVAGDLDFLVQDLQLPIVGQCLIDQARSASGHGRTRRSRAG